MNLIQQLYDMIIGIGEENSTRIFGFGSATEFCSLMSSFYHTPVIIFVTHPTIWKLSYA